MTKQTADFIKNARKMKKEASPGLAIALGSGIARGFAHIGVLNVLDRHGIRPSIIAGTSMGSVVGAAYLSGRLDELTEWARSLNRMKILSYLDFRIRSAGLIGGDRLQNLLAENFGELNMDQLPLPFRTVATDLVTGHEVWIKDGSVVDALTASFSLPGVFPPVERNHRFLIDGALVNPVPISACQAMGSRMTIAVDLNADILGKATKPGHAYPTIAGFDMLNAAKDIQEEEQKGFLKKTMAKRLFRREDKGPSLFGVMVSALGITQDRLSRSRLAGDPPDIHIKPKTGHIGLMEFERADELIKLGEDAALAMIDDIREAARILLPKDNYHSPNPDKEESMEEDTNNDNS